MSNFKIINYKKNDNILKIAMLKEKEQQFIFIKFKNEKDINDVIDILSNNSNNIKKILVIKNLINNYNHWDFLLRKKFDHYCDYKTEFCEYLNSLLKNEN